MTTPIVQVNPAPGQDTFQVWVDQTNKAINAVSTQCVTCNTHANGGLTTGNGYVEGTFGGRNLVANTVRGGTVQTPGLLTISSSVNVSGAATTITLGTVVINTSAVAVGGQELRPGGLTFTYTTTGTTTQEIDNFDKSVYRSGDYFISIKDNNANAFQVSKVLALHDGSITAAHLVEYAIAYTNTAMGVMSANANATHVKLFFTPTSSSTNLTGTKSLVLL